MKENIEEDIEVMANIITHYIEADKCGLSNNDFKKEIKALSNILSDYKRVLKENEELRAENDKLRVIKCDTNYGTETVNLIPKSVLVKINTNRYMIEIENGKFVDLKQVYRENEELKDKYDVFVKMSSDVIANSIPTQKVKDKIEEIKNRIDKYREYTELGIETDVEWVDNVADRQTLKTLQDLLEEKGE